MTDVRDEVRNFLLARFLPREDPAGLTDETPLIAGGILDPSGVAELAAFLGRRFGIAVGPHEAGIPHLDSVEAIVRLVTSRWGREATPTIEPEGPPPPVPPPAVWGVWYEGDGGDPPGWSDLCLSEAEARKRLETCVLPGHRHRYRVAVAGVAPDRPAEAEADTRRLDWIGQHDARVTKPPIFRGAWSVETPRISSVRFDLRAAIDVAMAFHDRPEEEPA
jgi:acyl carrier protein